jgi:hypothetical protein
MSSLVSDAPVIYHPEYDINTGKYVDVCPIPPRQSSVQYVCHCNGHIFNNKTKYTYHIKLKTHQRYIGNYHEMINDLGTAKSYISNLQLKNAALEKEVTRLKRQIQLLTPTPQVPILDELD